MGLGIIWLLVFICISFIVTLVIYQKDVFLIFSILSGICLFITVLIFVINEIDDKGYPHTKDEYIVCKMIVQNLSDLSVIEQQSVIKRVYYMNSKILSHRRSLDNIWIGRFFDKRVAELELIEIVNNHEEIPIQD